MQIGAAEEVNPLEFCSVVTGVWEPLQVGAAGQINRLEVSNVAKGVWVPLQVGATRQVNRLEARQAAKESERLCRWKQSDKSSLEVPQAAKGDW